MSTTLILGTPQRQIVNHYIYYKSQAVSKVSGVLGILPVGDVKDRIVDQLPNVSLMTKFLTGAEIAPCASQKSRNA